MSREKIVITGLGAVAPNGNNVTNFWEACVEGKSGIDSITYFDTAEQRVSIAGELKNFDPSSFLL